MPMLRGTGLGAAGAIAIGAAALGLVAACAPSEFTQRHAGLRHAKKRETPAIGRRGQWALLGSNQ